jgi:hypothetical protein
MTATDAHRFPKLVHVTSVEVLHDYVVRLGFSDGCAGELDLGPSLGRGVFEPLATDYALFRQVTVDPEARTLVWPNGADMAPEVLHLDAAKDCPDPWAYPMPRLTLQLDPEEGTGPRAPSRSRARPPEGGGPRPQRRR